MAKASSGFLYDANQNRSFVLLLYICSSQYARWFRIEVNDTTGVYGFDKFAGKPQQVSNELLAELKVLDSDVIGTSLKASDRVIFSDGQYKDIIAIFLEAENEKRSIMLIELPAQHVKQIVENSESKSM